MATIADVARAAGVSASTVSYVLSGRRAISATTRERVLRAVRDLGYRANAAAGALAAGRTRTIALVAPRTDDLTGVIIHQFVTTIVDVARGRDHDVLLLDPAEGVAGIRRIMASRRVDGVLLMDVDAADERVALLEESGLPTVVLGSPDATGLPCVDLDFAAAARLAVRHLAARGHTRMALLSPPELVGPPGKSYARCARAGFEDAAAEWGPGCTVRVCEPTWRGVEDWLGGVSRDLTGVVVQHEAALPLLLATLRRTGRDLAVVPICPAGIARQLERPVDHVDIPVAEMARAAAEALCDRLTTAGPVPSRIFEPSLVSAR